MQPLVDSLRDAVETGLTRRADQDTLIAAATAAHLTPKVADPASCARWPVLSAWKWLVPLSTELEDFGTEVDGRTRPEQGWDLAYRGVLRAALGASLRRAPTSDQLDDLAAELYGTHRDIPAATIELVNNLSCHEAAIGAAIGVLDADRCLVQGLSGIPFTPTTAPDSIGGRCGRTSGPLR